MRTLGFFAKFLNILEWTIFLTAFFSLLGFCFAMVSFYFFPPVIISPELESVLRSLT
jgi:hypothetical protein